MNKYFNFPERYMRYFSFQFVSSSLFLLHKQFTNIRELNIRILLILFKLYSISVIIEVKTMCGLHTL